MVCCAIHMGLSLCPSLTGAHGRVVHLAFNRAYIFSSHHIKSSPCGVTGSIWKTVDGKAPISCYWGAGGVEGPKTRASLCSKRHNLSVPSAGFAAPELSRTRKGASSSMKRGKKERKKCEDKSCHSILPRYLPNLCQPRRDSRTAILIFRGGHLHRSHI